MEIQEIGYFSKTHGIKGHLILKSNVEFYFQELKACFVDLAGSKAPYFVSEVKEVNNGLIIHLEEIDTLEKAKTLIGKKVYIDKELIAEVESDEEWIGFELIDNKFGSLGKISEVSDNGAQLLVKINYKGKDILLPLVDELISKIDEKKKTIDVNVPDGLIELYLD